MVRKAYPNQLLAFEGSFGFDSKKDYYDGTLFRLPFRLARSELTETVLGAHEVRNELQNYFTEARISLLFLKHVRSISFSVQGSDKNIWRVVRDMSHVADDSMTTFQSINCTVQNAGTETEDKFFTAFENQANDAHMPPCGQTRKNKRVSIGMAALLSSTIQTPGQDKSQSIKQDRAMLNAPAKMFSTLPLPIDSHLPVHIHATFALSGDRRSLIVSGEATELHGSAWNSELLKHRLPRLYFKFLATIARRIPDERVFDYWPDKRPSKNTCSESLWDGFWTSLPLCSEALFPKAHLKTVGNAAHRGAPELRTYATAIFDYREKEVPETMLPVLQPLLPNLCLTPRAGILRELKKSSPSNALTQEILRGLFKHNERAVKLLQLEMKEIKRYGRLPDALETILHEILSGEDASIKELHDCQIVPLQNGTLGTLLVNTEKPKLRYFRATKKELNIFQFAGGLLVHEHASDLFKRSSEGEVLNVYNLRTVDVPKLLSKRHNRLAASAEDDTWLVAFWAFFNPRLNKESPEIVDKVKGKIKQRRLCRATCGDVSVYKSLAELEQTPCVIQSSEEEHQKLCATIPGLWIIHTQFLPTSVQNAEASLDNKESFKRLINAILKLAQRSSITQFVGPLPGLEVSSHAAWNLTAFLRLD